MIPNTSMSVCVCVCVCVCAAEEDDEDDEMLDPQEAEAKLQYNKLLMPGTRETSRDPIH